MNKIGFKIDARLNVGSNLGRAGTIETPHGAILTPAFIPVGTKATVKSVLPTSMEKLGSQAILSNAYHLFLQPGSKIVHSAGSLAKFMGWNGPTFTDSGGFQVLSLGSGYKKILAMDLQGEIDKSKIIAKKGTRLARVDDDGVNFKSHLDGKIHRWTPEISMQVQHEIGADLIFAFDECTTLVDSYEYQKTSLERTRKWALRCIEEHEKLKNQDGKNQQLLGVIQGAQYEDLRKKACIDLGSLDGFDGFGIGGALEKSKLGTIIRWCCSSLPENKPKHLLGIGEVEDIFVSIENGIDSFDCVAPSRLARHGTALTTSGKKHISHGGQKLALDFSPIDKNCECYTCLNFTKSYINHLFKAKELLAYTLTTIHNEYFLVQLTANIRKSIIDNSYCAFKQNFLELYSGKICP